MVTMNELVKKILHHDKRLAEAGLTSDTAAFDQGMLENLN